VGLWAADKCEITAIVGYNNPHRETIVQSAQKFKSIKVLPAQEKFAQFSSEFDLVITAAGATVWESAYLGLPTLALVVAQNQVPLAAAVQELGIGINLGWNSDLVPAAITEKLQKLINQPALLESMSQRALDLIDGHGVNRVTQEIEQLLK
jgi:spore coat polysaccharide biosynthesis predicted glycosyltransferase SpsG